MDATVVGLSFSPTPQRQLHHFYRRDPVRMGLQIDSVTGQVTWGPREGEQGMIVSEPDPIRRLVSSVQAFDQLRTGQAAMLIMKQNAEDLKKGR